MLNLAYGLFIGFFAVRLRMQGQPELPKYLRNAHVGPLMQGPMLLGLVFAVGLSDLSAGVEELAAWLLVIGSAALDLGDTLLWIRGTPDAFADRRDPGAVLGGIATVLSPAGILILTVGTIRGL